MTMYDELIDRCKGAWQRADDHTHKVSFWYVPGGCDYDNAEIKEVFFHNKEDADAFAAAMYHPPECPMVMEVDFGMKEGAA